MAGPRRHDSPLFISVHEAVDDDTVPTMGRGRAKQTRGAGCPTRRFQTHGVPAELVEKWHFTLGVPFALTTTGQLDERSSQQFEARIHRERDRLLGVDQ
jgi:hypothetical protein